MLKLMIWVLAASVTYASLITVISGPVNYGYNTGSSANNRQPDRYSGYGYNGLGNSYLNALRDIALRYLAGGYGNLIQPYDNSYQTAYYGNPNYGYGGYSPYYYGYNGYTPYY